MKEEVIKKIMENKIISILRGVSTENAVGAVQAIYAGGIVCAEITFDQSGKISFEETAKQIKAASEVMGEKMLIGAGTVLNVAQVELAHQAGARYIISPNVDEAVIKRTNELGMVSIPGALTPTETATACRYGADFVKLFPLGNFGVSYAKAIMAPLSNVKFLAVGGINDQNMMEYLNCGICGVGIGNAIVDRKIAANCNYEEITKRVQKYTKQLREAEKE